MEPARHDGVAQEQSSPKHPAACAGRRRDHRHARGSSQRQGDARQDLAKRRQVKLSAFADAVAPGLALVQAIDRWATGSTRNFGKTAVWCSHRPPERGGAGRRRCPPACRAAPASPSASPSIRPSAAAGAPSVAVSRLGSRAVESRGLVGQEAGRSDARPVPASAPAARSLHHSWPQSRLASRSAAM
jgi:hypothetical protein